MRETEKQNKQDKIELLAPAGSYETFLAVLEAGADAVYLGGSRFGARAHANNFTEPELRKAIDYAHLYDRKVYLTVNTLLKEEELEKELYDYLLPYYEQGLDAVIVQDMGALALIKKELPDIQIHTSTQMTITGAYGAGYMKSLGASRIVTARELSLAEIREIHEKVDIEIESFVHGALCYCYSGQCLFSSMLGGRSGNRGRCGQACRLPYEVYDSKRRRIPGKGDFVLSPKDLNTIDAIPMLAKSGVRSFKIEGRMKQAEYAAGVVSVYREYIDRYLADEAFYQVTREDDRKLFDLGNRSGFTDGYYTRRNGADMITYDRPNHTKGSDALQKEIRRTYIGIERKEKINGILILKKDFPAMLELSSGSIHIKREGQMVQGAKNQPLSEHKVRESISKTGDTFFAFGHLELQMEEDVFLPVQAIKQLRREGLEELFAVRTREWRREKPLQSTDSALTQPEGQGTLRSGASSGKEENLAVSIEQRSQLAAVVSWSYANDIYLDSSCYTREHLLAALSEDVASIHRAGKKAYYVFPTIFRNDTAAFYETILADLLACGLNGVVVRNYDAAAFVGTNMRGLPMILDFGIYSWNKRAQQSLSSFCPLRDTVPLELNKRELFGRDNKNSEILIYGRTPMMLSAQCVRANMTGCDKQPSVCFLKDRQGKYFPVKNHCAECYNVIYNMTPQMLFAFREDFRRMQMAGYRLSFTTESPKETREILSCCEDIFLTGKKKASELFKEGSYTNGHYKRGVE